MAYDKTEWNTGDIVTAQKLNNIERGIEDVTKNLIFYVTTDSSHTTTCNKTYEEAKAMFDAFGDDTNIPVYMVTGGEIYNVNTIKFSSNLNQIGYGFRSFTIVSSNSKLVFTLYSIVFKSDGSLTCNWSQGQVAYT